MKFFAIPIRLIKNPNSEWKNIHFNKLDIKIITQHYLIPLILFTCIIKITGRVLSIEDYSLLNAVLVCLSYITINFGNIFASAWIINKLIPKFKSEQNFNTVFKLISFSAFPFIIANSIASVHPGLSFIHLISIYSLVLLWIGSKELLQISDEVHTGFVLICIVVIATVALIINFLIMTLLLSIFHL